MAVKNHIILRGLIQERDEIHAALSQDVSTLKARLAAVELLVTFYQSRSEAEAQGRLPKTLKTAVKIRSEANGNGQRKISGAQRQRERIVAILRSVQTGRHPGKQASVYLRHGYIAHNSNGTYSITPSGKKKLAALTGHDASTP